jgi:hypothetical protein
MSERRVSKVCPTCGCTEFKKVRPRGWIAFIDDRKCLECGDCYTPPTPRWAGVCFIVIGVLFVLPFPVEALLDLATGRPPNVGGWACSGLLGLLGVAAIIHGVRSWMEAGKV